MKKFLILPLLFLSITAMAACSTDDTPEVETQQPVSPEQPLPDNPGDSVRTKTLVAYFSAQGHTQAVAERIAEVLGTDIFRIEAAEPYAENPYNDSERIQDEAYNDRRPAVGNLPDAETIAAYDTLFIGSPIWWHQPAMVVCTFLESYDLKGKVVIPFFTYGATTYLNESMQTLYRVTPGSEHLPATLPEDLDPDNIREPQNDDAGIPTPRNANGVEGWLRELGVLQ